MLPTRRATLVRLSVVATPLILLACVLVGRAAYLAYSQESQDRTNLMLMTRTPSSLGGLESQSKQLSEVAANIDQHSLSDIRELLDRTAVTARYVSREIQAQQDAWRYVQTKSVADAETYRKIQADLNIVTKIQEQEIVRLNSLLDQAKNSPLSITILTSIASFVLGILSSLISSHLYDQWKSRKSAEING